MGSSNPFQRMTDVESNPVPVANSCWTVSCSVIGDGRREDMASGAGAGGFGGSGGSDGPVGGSGPSVPEQARDRQASTTVATCTCPGLRRGFRIPTFRWPSGVPGAMVAPSGKARDNPILHRRSPQSRTESGASEDTRRYHARPRSHMGQGQPTGTTRDSPDVSAPATFLLAPHRLVPVGQFARVTSRPSPIQLPGRCATA